MSSLGTGSMAHGEDYTSPTRKRGTMPSTPSLARRASMCGVLRKLATKQFKWGGNALNFVFPLLRRVRVGEEGA